MVSGEALKKLQEQIMAWPMTQRFVVQQLIRDYLRNREDLRAYEATRLTPRGVEILKEEKLSSDGMILLGRLMGKKLHEIGCERLRELVEAGADGRAITLPCKLGGEVWAPGCGRTVKLRVVEAALLLQGEDGEGYEKLSDFGKTFFATKEGAEEAKRNEWFT